MSVRSVWLTESLLKRINSARDKLYLLVSGLGARLSSRGVGQGSVDVLCQTFFKVVCQFEFSGMF